MLRSRLRGSQPVSTWLRGGGTGITRIQRGTISIAAAATSNTATLTNAVDTTRSRVVWLGLTDNGAGTTADTICVRVALTNSTTVTATVNSTSGDTRVIAYEVIEYAIGVIKAIRRGTITTTGSASGTDTITAVDTTKSTLDYLGFTTTYSGATVPANAMGRVELTNGTTVTFAGIGALDRTAGYQVVEFN